MKKIYLILVLVLCYSCEPEENDLSQDLELLPKNEVLVQILKGQQIEKNKPILSALKKFEDHNQKFQKAELSNSKYNFQINTSVAKYIEKEDYHSYNFPVEKPGSNGKVINLLLSLNKQGSYNVFLVTYDFTKEELQNLPTEALSSRKVRFLPIDFDYTQILPNSNNKWSITYEVICKMEWVETVDQGQAVGDGNDDHGLDHRYLVPTNECFTIKVISTDDNGNGPDYGDPDPGYDSGGSSGGSDPGDPTFEDPGIITGPITSLEPSILGTQIINLLNLDINSRHHEWATNSTDEDLNIINNFIVSNDYTDELIEEAKMLIDTEIVTKRRKWDTSQTGTYLGRNDLKYTAKYKVTEVESMYLLENGLVLYVADGPKAINKDPSFPSSEVNPNGYHYLYSYDTKRYYEYRMPPLNYPSSDLNFLFEGFWNGVKIFGRYATPLEDAIILIDGKDFDGVSQSRAVAGVLIFVDVIPGGKIIRITKKSGLALDAVSPAFRAIDEIYTSQKRIIEEYRDVITNAIGSRKGNFAEMSVDVEWFQKGYEDLHINKITNIDAGGHQGIDHIFKNPVTNEYIIVESKFYGAGGLTPENLATGLPRQMSDAWIDNGLPDSRLLQALGNNLNLYTQVKNNYQRVVGYVKANGEINYKYVNSSGYEVSIYPTP